MSKLLIRKYGDHDNFRIISCKLVDSIAYNSCMELYIFHVNTTLIINIINKNIKYLLIFYEIIF